jgi:diadenosine tetraphosphate (Ap4A) HIT family hydrolase
VKPSACALCEGLGGHLVWQGSRLRVVRVSEGLESDTARAFPALYRVVWQDHVAEFSDLNAADRALCMEAVLAVERTLREQLQPTKINIASLGNVVPHLHWHVVARFDWDSHFPAPIWTAAQRTPDVPRMSGLKGRIGPLDAAVAVQCARL